MQKKTELITNKDGSIFHLNLLPGDISTKIVIVGDPGRVDMLASLMDNIRVKKENREFHTVTGSFENSEITVISSGIGTDNIDILVNELDALVNIDLNTGICNEEPVHLLLSGLAHREDCEPMFLLVPACLPKQQSGSMDFCISMKDMTGYLIQDWLIPLQNILSGQTHSPILML